MVKRVPASEDEAQAVLEYLATQRMRLHIFSGIMSAEHVTKVYPLPHDPALVIYHINYVYEEHALAVDSSGMLWLNLLARDYPRLYENPHLSRWYFQALATRDLTVDELAQILSLALPRRPVTSRLVHHGDDIPLFQRTPSMTSWPQRVFDDEAARRHLATTHIQPPQRHGRIITFWMWQAEQGGVDRFKVLINVPFRRLIIARHELTGMIGDYYQL
jgi:hypothetical protein